MLKVKRKFARVGVPKWEVLQDVDKLEKTLLICPISTVIDRRLVRGDVTIIRWCTVRCDLEEKPNSVHLLVPVRGGGLGAMICVALYLADRDGVLERVMVCTDDDKLGVLSSAASNMLIRSRTPRTDKLSCDGYTGELLELFGSNAQSGDDASSTLNMSLDYEAFISVFGHFMQSEVYLILNDKGSLDLNWLSLNRNGISASEALRLHEKGEGGCPMCIETIEKVPGTLEFCITNMLSTLLREAGHAVHFNPVPNLGVAQLNKEPAYGGSVNLRDFYRTARIGRVEGDLKLLGNIMPDASQRNTMAIGLRKASLCDGLTVILVTEQCLLDQGNLRRLRNLRGYIQLLCTCIGLQNGLEAQGVHATVIRLGPTRNVVCSSFSSHTLKGRIHGYNARMARIGGNASVTKADRKWSDVLDKRTIKLLSLDIELANWVFFTVILQVKHSYQYVIIKQTGVDESYTAVDRCLDFDLVKYENGDFILSLQGATRLLEFFRSYATREVPALAWEFVFEAAKLECVLKISSPV